MKKYVYNSDKFLIIAGPCVVESKEMCFKIAEEMIDICEELNFSYVFKASFEKANRTSKDSFRTLGIEESLRILQEVKEQFQVPIITDVHETTQIELVKPIVDIIQIPAFLCRQTELLEAAGRTGLAVNIKKGQFMAAKDMKYAVEKVEAQGSSTVFLTERGTFFGYGDLVVDFRNIPIMQEFAPVIFDVTHSIQLPGAGNGKSSGNPKMAPVLTRAAVAVGVDGLFIETHPDPGNAKSDGPNMIPLNDMMKFCMNILY